MEGLMKKKFYSIIVTLLMLFFVPVTIQSTTAKAKTFSGKCGQNASWSYDTKKYILTIHGKGTVNQAIELPPDEEYPDTIVIQKGITSLKCTKDGISPLLTCRVIECPSSLTSISFGAFNKISVSEIYLSKNLKGIGNGAFFGIRNCESISMPKSNPYYYCKNNILFSKDLKRLIYYPTGLEHKKYTIPQKVIKIMPLAFAQNTNLKEIVLPKNLRSIGGGAFFHCTRLQKINLTAKTNIDALPDFDASKYIAKNNIILDCHDETLIKYLEYSSDPRKNRSCYLGVFEGTSIQKITIPDKVTFLPSNTFLPLSAEDADDILTKPLQEITLGKSFTGRINTGGTPYSKKSLMLYDLPLKKVHIAKENKKYIVKNNILYSKNSKTLYQVLRNYNKDKLIIPAKVQRIAKGAFMNSPFSLETISIKGNLQSIDAFAFADCKASRLTVKKNIQTIGRAAFASTNIETFQCKGKIQTIKKDAFAALKNQDVLYPKSVQNYIKKSY